MWLFRFYLLLALFYYASGSLSPGSKKEKGRKADELQYIGEVEFKRELDQISSQIQSVKRSLTDYKKGVYNVKSIENATSMTLQTLHSALQISLREEDFANKKFHVIAKELERTYTVKNYSLFDVYFDYKELKVTPLQSFTDKEAAVLISHDMKKAVLGIEVSFHQLPDETQLAPAIKERKAREAERFSPKSISEDIQLSEACNHKLHGECLQNKTSPPISGNARIRNLTLDSGLGYFQRLMNNGLWTLS